MRFNNIFLGDFIFYPPNHPPPSQRLVVRFFLPRLDILYFGPQFCTIRLYWAMDSSFLHLIQHHLVLKDLLFYKFLLPDFLFQISTGLNDLLSYGLFSKICTSKISSNICSQGFVFVTVPPQNFLTYFLTIPYRNLSQLHIPFPFSIKIYHQIFHYKSP